MGRRNWIVVGSVVAIMVVGMGIGIAIHYCRAPQQPAPGPVVLPHQQRTEQAGQATAQRARVLRQQRGEALQRYEKMPPGQQRQLVADQVHRTLEPNAPRGQAILGADQRAVARQIVEETRGMTPEQRREYLKKFVERERARLAAQQGVDPNRGPADANAQASPVPAEGGGQGQTSQ